MHTRPAEVTEISRAIPVEQVISVKPFVVRRRIAFRDCDPAGIVYTPRFFDPMATGAMDLFMMELIGPMGQRMEEFTQLATPAKAVELVFHKPSPLGALIDITVNCADIGRSTFGMGLVATDAEGDQLFSGRLTIICVDRDTFKAIPVPELLKEKLLPYLSEENEQ